MKVQITIPKRPEFGNAYWAIQRRFESGIHVVEVNERELAELREDPVLGLVESAELEAKMAAETEPPGDPSAPPAPPPADPSAPPAPPPPGPGKPLKRG